MTYQNDPAREGGAVECLLGGDTDGYNTTNRTRKPILRARLSEEAIERSIWREVNQWDVTRRVNGRVPGHGRLRKEDAPAALGQALARLAERGEL